jgi:hypothetical protein
MLRRAYRERCGEASPSTLEWVGKPSVPTAGRVSVPFSKDRDDAPKTHSGLPLVGPEKGRRIEIRGVRIKRHFEILNHALEDCLDDLDAARKALIAVQSLALETQELFRNREDPFGPEFP